MDSEVNLFLERANNELLAAKVLKKVSEEEKIKAEMQIPSETTFYSSVISHSYYAIFHTARAALLTVGIKIDSPFIHNKAYEQFKREFVDNGKLDKHILEVYETMLMRAQDLLQIMKQEKKKRGMFIYKSIPKANEEPAETSINNARLFVSSITKFIKTESP
jgi:uncharacterized protein (UPF0332 family)